MKFVLRCRWSLWAFLLCWIPNPLGQTVQNIHIRHIGPPAASDAYIRANIRIKEGDPYLRTGGVDDDILTLYGTGLFHNIRIVEELLDDGINLTFVVQGKLTVTDIRFEGNERFSDRRLRRRISTKVGEKVDELKLFNDTQEILKMYQKVGRQRTTVKHALIPDENLGRATVVFEIEETPRVRIERVEFVGADAFSQRRLRKAVKTRRHWMFSWITGSGVVKDDVMEEDRQRLRDFYLNEGYIDFELRDIEFVPVDEKNQIIRFHVFEGNQYRVGSLQIRNNQLFTAEEILQGDRNSRGVRMTVGEVFTPKGLSSDVEAIRDFYGGKGYIDTWVRAVKIPNVETGTMDLIYEIQDEDRGQSFIERIDIRGNVRTKDKVIRRELAVTPGEVFDMVRVKLSKSRLQQMGYFEKVETEVEPTDIPNYKNLVIDVEEGSTGNFELGAGFSSVESLMFIGGYREGNFDLFNPPYFRGGGQKLRLSGKMCNSALRNRGFWIGSWSWAPISITAS
jgi:outer membrane protein insertion porin family